MPPAGRPQIPLPATATPPGGPPTMQPARNPLPPQLGRVIAAEDPNEAPIDFASAINISHQQNTAVVETVTPVELDLQLDPASVGVIRTFITFVAPVTAATDIRWALLINGSPVPGMDDLKVFASTADSKSDTFGVKVLLPKGCLVQVRMRNVDGGAYSIGAAYSGWQYPAAFGRQHLSVEGRGP